ncbi:MAG: nitroreductase family protein, partial [Anaerolineae bacterium]|nr:nitroreductase family protein [Anaerolineae bacterium]
MDFYETVGKRRMVRNFTDEPVAAEALTRILDAARRGPSAGFTQGQDFVVVTDPEKKGAIARLCHEEGYVEAGFDPFLSRAPVLIVPCTNENAYHRRYQESDKVDDEGHEINWPVPYWFMDIGCAVMLILLAVVAEGLAAA